MVGFWFPLAPARDHSSAWLDYPQGTRFTMPDRSLSSSLILDIPMESPAPLEFPQYVQLDANNDRRCYFVDDYEMLWNGTNNAVMRCTLTEDDLMTAIEQGFIVRGDVAVLPTTTYGTVTRANFDLYPTIATAYPSGDIYSEYQRTTTVVVYTVQVDGTERYGAVYHAGVDNVSDLRAYWYDFSGGTVGSYAIQRFVGAWICPYNKVAGCDPGSVASGVRIGDHTWSVFGATVIGAPTSERTGSLHASNTYLPQGFETVRIGNAMTNVTVSTGLPITINYSIQVSPTEDGVIQVLEVNGARVNLTESTSVPISVFVAKDKTALATLNNTLATVGNAVRLGVSLYTGNASGAYNSLQNVVGGISTEYNNVISSFSQNGQALIAVSQNLNNTTTFLGVVGVSTLASTSDTDYLDACAREYGYTVTNFGLLEFNFLSPVNWYLQGKIQIYNARVSLPSTVTAVRRSITAKNLSAYFARGIYFYTP